MSTIKDVANRAGVGVSTVSRYLSKNGYVSEQAKKKIEKAIKELNYYPNANARSIRGKPTHTIAFLIPSISNQFFPQLATFIEDILFENGYKMILCNTNGSALREEKYVEVILENRIDGVISSTGEISSNLIQKNIPIVAIDRIRGESHDFVVSVTSNNYLGGEQAANHLIDCGCKKIACLYGPQEFDPVRLRREGFVDQARKRNVEVKCMSFYSDYSVKEINDEYDGVFIWNDISAITFIAKCQEMNIRIPDDLQVIGFDDIDLLKYYYPKLSTISQPMRQLATEAVNIVLEMIATKKKLGQDIVLDTTLVARDTTKGN